MNRNILTLAVAAMWIIGCGLWAQEKDADNKQGNVRLLDIMTSLGPKGDPQLKKVLFALGDDIGDMLNKLDDIMASGSTDRSKTVEAWQNAQIYEEWNTKMSEAREMAKRQQEARGFDFATWPADLNVWRKHMYQFLTDIASKGQEAIAWKYDIDSETAAMKHGLSWDPKKFKEIHQELTWADTQMKESRAMFVKAMTVKAVKEERKRFTRIWKVVNNMRIQLVERKKVVEAFFKDAAPDRQRKGLDDLNKWRDTVANERWLGSCGKAVENWSKLCQKSLDDYAKTYAELKTLYEPLSKETFGQDIDTFKNASSLNGLVSEIEKYERQLIQRENELRELLGE